MPDSKLAVFNNQAIRRVLHNDEWWFVIADVIAVSTNSPNPADYIKKIRSRDKELSTGWDDLSPPLDVREANKVNSAYIIFTY